MVVNISRASEETLDKIRARIIAELFSRGKKGASSRHLSPKVSMTSKQLGMFLKRMKAIKREKGSRGYIYYADIPEPPHRVEYGDEWVEIEEATVDGMECIKITSSRKDEKIVRKGDKDEKG